MIKIKQRVKKVSATTCSNKILEDLTTELKELRQNFDAQMEALKPLQAKIDEIEKQILEEADMVLESDEKKVINGVEIGAKGNQTTVSDIIKVAEILSKQSPTLFFELANPSITNLRQYMTPAELGQCTETKATRKRTINIK